MPDFYDEVIDFLRDHNKFLKDPLGGFHGRTETATGCRGFENLWDYCASDQKTY